MNRWSTRALTGVGAGLICGALLAGCASGGGGGAVSHATATPSPAPTSTPTPTDQQFVSDMRSDFGFKNTVSDGTIAAFGEQVCASIAGGGTVASEEPYAQSYWTGPTAGELVLMINLAETDICPSVQQPQTVVYIVTGNSADVTYGPAGSDIQGSVPMTVSQPLSNPSYYSINAQLNGGGVVNCALQVDGVTISSASASGGYNIASCEMDQDPTTEAWENTNTG